MKQVVKTLTLRLVIVLMLAFFETMLFAQEGSSSSTNVTKTTTTTETTWYAQPWVWAVGAAVFILLLVALLRGNSKRASS